MKNHLLTNSKITDCIPHIDTHAQYMTSSTYDLQWSFPSPLGGSVAQHINRQTRRRLRRELTRLKLFCSLAIRRSIKKLRMKGTYKVKVTHQGEKNRSGTVHSLKTDWKQRRNSERGAAPGPETNAKPKDNFSSPVYRPLHEIQICQTSVS